MQQPAGAHSVPFVSCQDNEGNTHQVAVKSLHWRPAAYAIIIKDNAILLSQQDGAWNPAGGAVELGETPETAVIREVYEETGTTVANPQLLACLTSFYTFKSTQESVHSLLLYYHCEYVSGELSIDNLMEDEKAHVGMPAWVPLSELPYITAGSSVDWRAVVAAIGRR